MQPAEDSSFYQAFVGAANSVSQLFTQAQKEQKAAAAGGTRLALERTADWLDSQGSGDTVPKAVLRQFLNEEYMKAGGGELYSRTQRALQEAQQGPHPPGPNPSSLPPFPWNVPGQHPNCHQNNFFTSGTGSIGSPFSPLQNSENQQRETNPLLFPQFGGAAGQVVENGHGCMMSSNHIMLGPPGPASGNP